MVCGPCKVLNLTHFLAVGNTELNMSQTKVGVHTIFEYRIHTQIGSLCLLIILHSTLDHKKSILEVSEFGPSSDGMQTSPILFPSLFFQFDFDY